MAKDLHTIAVATGSDLSNEDRLVVLMKKQLANSAGGGAGQSVTIAVTGLTLPASYAVQATPDQDATVWISGRSQTGFTINLAPRLAANTLAVGKVDVVVMA
jgi:type IV secretory pathway VirJ component